MSMRRATSVLLVIMGLSSTGCYYDQWKAQERANKSLQERLTEAEETLQNCEYMNKQKDIEIDALSKQLAARGEQLGSMQSEVSGLRSSLRSSQQTLEEMAKSGPGEVIITPMPVLPPQLDADLKELASQYPDAIEYDPQKGAVRWKSDLLFPLGSDSLAENTISADALEKFAQIVRSSATGFDVIVVGHTCTTPIRRAETLAKHPTNWHLSAHRSIAVMNLLASQNIAQNRMGVMGYGEYRPIASNGTQDGRAKNRRVEIYLVPRDSVRSMSMGVFEVKERGLAFVMDRAILPDES